MYSDFERYTVCTFFCMVCIVYKCLWLIATSWLIADVLLTSSGEWLYCPCCVCVCLCVGCVRVLSVSVCTLILILKCTLLKNTNRSAWGISCWVVFVYDMHDRISIIVKTCLWPTFLIHFVGLNLCLCVWVCLCLSVPINSHSAVCHTLVDCNISRTASERTISVGQCLHSRSPLPPAPLSWSIGSTVCLKSLAASS